MVAGGIATLVDGRAFPMFGVLFGYGVARIAARQCEQGVSRRSVRWLLWRRSLVLVVLGFLDAMLFYIGDILGAYGVLLFVGVWVLRWKDRWILLAALFLVILTALPNAGSMAISADPPDISMLPPNFLDGLQARLPVQPVIALPGLIGFACPFLVGIWAGRRRVLERPEQYKGLLGATAAIGIGAGIVGALPVSLWIAEVTHKPQADLFGPLHDATGTLGGFGYAALIALIAIKLKNHPGRITLAIAAVGQRSLTCYLTQSVVWTVAFTPYLAGLADNLSVTAAALLATATWLLTVLPADQLRRAEYQGPFEILIRRITYNRPVEAVTVK
ncbi:DUF418 domain-containing protein [Kribbella qitaiheensis]|uniref:DUF418 domain-containing protein n=1 Tax=Kribbella qitaiheensis TaxID=1544730 RepID=UPI001FEA56D6|nr:DUF418 domain-containing protein [Kribbella qitaiheensis]